jgi:hypothetical protein
VRKAGAKEEDDEGLSSAEVGVVYEVEADQQTGQLASNSPEVLGKVEGRSFWGKMEGLDDQLSIETEVDDDPA